MNEYILKFIIGGLIVLSVSSLSKFKQYELAGIVAFMPAAALTSYFIIGYTNGARGLQEIVGYSLLSIPSLIIFLIVLYFLLKYQDYKSSLIISMGVWLLVAIFTYQSASHN